MRQVSAPLEGAEPSLEQTESSVFLMSEVINEIELTLHDGYRLEAESNPNPIGNKKPKNLDWKYYQPSKAWGRTDSLGESM